jgi:hypothetical protein
MHSVHSAAALKAPSGELAVVGEVGLMVGPDVFDNLDDFALKSLDVFALRARKLRDDNVRLVDGSTEGIGLDVGAEEANPSIVQI